MTRDHCTCPPRPRGPPWDDGVDDGPCAYCEEQSWRTEHGQHDEDFEAMLEGTAGLSRDEALAAMGEAEDSLMLGGSGGGERDPDLEWY